MDKESSLKLALSLVLSFVITFSACSNNVGSNDGGGKNPDSTQVTKTAVVSIKMHDSPTELLDKVNIHIDRVEIKTAKNSNWEIASKPDQAYNFLDLVNGKMVSLEEHKVEPGHYTKLRISFGDKNSISINGQSHSLNLPKDVVTGIDVNLVKNGHATVYIDVNLKGIKKRVDGYQLIPAIRVYKKDKTGIITGRVAPAKRVRVNAKLVGSDSVFTSTYTDNTNGKFKLIGLIPGVYDLKFIPPGDNKSFKLIHVDYKRIFDSKDIGVFGLGRSDLLPSASEKWTRRLLKPGIELLQRNYIYHGAFRNIDILVINPKASGVDFGVASTYGLSGGRRMFISEIGRLSGAVAASNAGFDPGGGSYWNQYSHYGIFKVNGKIIPFFDWNPADKNKWKSRNDLQYIMGLSAVGIDSQGNVYFKKRPEAGWGNWSKVEDAIAGGNMIITDGKVTINQALFEPPLANNNSIKHMVARNPRTVVCQTKKGTVAIFAIGGRFRGKQIGMTLKELANYLLSFGCQNAINYDGGGSTTMWTKGFGVVNFPADGSDEAFDHSGERDLITSFVVYYQN